MDERRVFKRIPVNFPAAIYLKSRPGHKIDAEVLDISEGGAFVHGTVPVALGEEVTVEIKFTGTQAVPGKVIHYEEVLKKTGHPNFTEASVVRWARGSAQSGFGIEFINPSEETRKFIRAVIAHFEKLSAQSKRKTK